jgi:hypothetical protein
MDVAATFPGLTVEETAYLESCLARRREMIALAQKSADGQILAACEEAAFDMAQSNARELLSAGIDSAIAEVEKKGEPRGCANAPHAARIVGRINARS